MVSVDGNVWDSVEDAAGGGDDDNLLRGACFTGDRYLAVGGSVRGRIVSTRDGRTFSPVLDDQAGWFGACAANDDGSIIVAIGSGRTVRSVDGGATWIDPTQHFPWNMRDVNFDGTRFVGVGNAGVTTSLDGVAWTAPSAPANAANLHRLVVARSGLAAGLYVARGDQFVTSTDLLTWTVIPNMAAVHDVAHDGAAFFAVGEGSIWRSTDGVTWTPTAAPAMGRITIGGGVYVGAQFPGVMRTSGDGNAWVNTLDDDDNAVEDIVYGVR